MCLHWKSFLPLPYSKFTCQDIRELQQEKTVVFAQALQFWVEKASLPTQGQPCLLAGSIVELREEIKCYVSFSDEDVFSGMVLPEDPLVTQSKEAAPESAQPTQADSPVKEAITKVAKESTKREKLLNQFPGWKEVIPPCRLVVAARQLPPICKAPNKDPVVRVPGKGWFDSRATMSQRCKSPSQNPHHPQESWRWSGKWHCLLASLERLLACGGTNCQRRFMKCPGTL